MGLHEFLDRTGMTNAQLANEIGVTYQTVWYWRRGEKSPTLEHLAKIEKISKGRVTAATWKVAE